MPWVDTRRTVARQILCGAPSASQYDLVREARLTARARRAGAAHAATHLIQRRVAQRAAGPPSRRLLCDTNWCSDISGSSSTTASSTTTTTTTSSSSSTSSTSTSTSTSSTSTSSRQQQQQQQQLQLQQMPSL